MCGKWNVRQATLQHMFKVTTFCTDTWFPSLFRPDQLYRPPHCAEIQSMSQQDAFATRPYRRLVLDTREKMKNMKKLCILQVSAVTFFRFGG